jgi:hypothetical protein
MGHSTMNQSSEQVSAVISRGGLQIFVSSLVARGQSIRRFPCKSLPSFCQASRMTMDRS